MMLASKAKLCLTKHEHAIYCHSSTLTEESYILHACYILLCYRLIVPTTGEILKQVFCMAGTLEARIQCISINKWSFLLCKSEYPVLVLTLKHSWCGLVL